jgi:hypothetical protein
MSIGVILDYGVIQMSTGFYKAVWNHKLYLHVSDNRKEYLVLKQMLKQYIL